MKYQVNITETHYGFVEVEAESEEQARELAYDMVCEGQAHWGKMEIEAGKVTEIE